VGGVRRCNRCSHGEALQRRVPRVFASNTSEIRLIVKRLFSATLNSLRGLRWGVGREPAVREEVIALAFALPVGIFIAPNAAWYVGMIGALLIVLAVEFLNTAIEKFADHITKQQHREIGMVKDLGSAAVLCTLCLAGIVWFAALAVRCGLI
jgi:diacylglycerol kinase (ATP)